MADRWYAVLFERRKRGGGNRTTHAFLLLALIASASSWAPTTRNRSACYNKSRPIFSPAHYYAPARRNNYNVVGALFMASESDTMTLPTIHGVASAGISQEELSTAVTQALTSACEGLGVSFSLDRLHVVETSLPSASPSSTAVPGSTGRVLLFQTSSVWSEEETEHLKLTISQELDDLLYSEKSSLRQPILLSIQNELPAISETISWGNYLDELIHAEVQEYEMNIPLARKGSPNTMDDSIFIPSLQLEVDGAMVSDTTGGSTSTSTSGTDEDAPFWDTSSVLIFDHLVDNDLRKRLLDVVLGKEDEEEDGAGGDDWDDMENGPDPRRWIRGGLMDTPDQDAGDDDNDDEDTENKGGPCWGLTEDAVEDICFEHHDAFTQFEVILSELLSDYTVSRLPEAVMGSSISPLTANAPTCGDTFEFHIDGDPMLSPPSPWTDIYGRYPNRSRGKPRFMSCLIYLNEKWDADAWGAPTRIRDYATDLYHDVTPKPGRCVLMDQDITHSVVAPMEAAGKRPRYSLVFKLILHPKLHGQDMKNIQAKRKSWPEPVLLGSAKR